jgi:hypothetical protein
MNRWIVQWTNEKTSSLAARLFTTREEAETFAAKMRETTPAIVLAEVGAVIGRSASVNDVFPRPPTTKARGRT